jgi:transcriptional regulator with XRE-family HTH domain
MSLPGSYSLCSCCVARQRPALPPTTPALKPQPGPAREPDGARPSTHYRRTGRAVQTLRTGWSLDQLTARSGVSKGVLVALEHGRSNPNLATLAGIADAFGVPVTRLIDVTDEPGVRITGPTEAKVLWKGPAGGHGEIIAATEPPWAAELWRWRLQPGEQFGGSAHAPATREMAWVEAGTLTLAVTERRSVPAPWRNAQEQQSLRCCHSGETAAQVAEARGFEPRMAAKPNRISSAAP